MLAPAGAVQDVDVRRFLLGARLPRLDVVVLRMTAARRQHLVMLQRFEVFPRDQLQYLAYRHASARPNLSTARLDIEPPDIGTLYTIVHSVAPKSKVNVSPDATVNVEP
jgi:hypothetical protein